MKLKYCVINFKMSNDLQHRGSLEVIIGPMFCGKTSLGIQRATVFADTGFKVARINHSLDVRGNHAGIICEKTVTTHNSSFTGLSGKISQFSTDSLNFLIEDMKDFNVIFVDEAQFFSDLYEVVIEWVEKDGKHLIVSGLCGDFRRMKFGQILDLIPHCDTVEKLQARCYYCLEDLSKSNFKGNIMAISAPFTFRKNGNKDQIYIGGQDDYVPVCRYHHNFFSAYI